MLLTLHRIFKLRKNRYMGRAEGAALVEFALILPLLLLLICGIFDFGNLYLNVHTVNEAARAGARYGSVQPLETLPSAVVSYVRNNYDNNRNNYDNNLTVTVTPNQLVSKGIIKVTVRKSVPIITPLIGQFFGQNPYVAEGTCVMGLEN